MKHFAYLFLISGLLITLNACKKVVGKGPVVSETRTTREFSEIDFGVPGEVIFHEANDVKIEIEAQRNIIDIIETYVSGDELKIKVRDNRNISSSENIRITVHAPGVHSLRLSGSGILTVPGDFSPTNADLRLSGSGKIKMNSINTDILEIRLSGSGKIEVLDGSAVNEIIAVSGSGDVDLQNVEGEKANTQTSGSGNIKLNASKELEVKISGSGDVYYTGNPEINVSVSGSGRLIKL
jgi:DUF4097 and DUF4098 domain-containing protein YvlB